MEDSVFKFLWRYARKLKWLCLLMVIMMLFGQLFSRSTNWASAQIVETISQGKRIMKRCILLSAICC